LQRVAIIGGGVAGLTTALYLRDQAAELPGGLEISILEAGSRVGGNIRTDACDGFIVERGPNGYLDDAPATAALVKRLSLTSEVQKAADRAAKRYLYRDGRLHLLPTGPLAFIRSRVLSPRGRARLLLEPLARRKAEEVVDETVHEFASRRIGSEAADVLIDAMVSGIFAGDTRKLSLVSTFPKLATMEAKHGSLTRGMLARRKPTRSGGPAGPAGTLTSFRRGMQTLTDRLSSGLDGDIHLNCEVAGIEPTALAGHATRWHIETTTGRTFDADAIVVAIPAAKAAPLLTGVDRTLGETLGRIPTASLVVIALGYDVAAIGGPPDGFGFLIPRGEGLRSLGCLWDSSIFPGRAPEDKALMRVMIGGAHDPEAAELDDESLLRIAAKDLETTMQLTATPLLSRVYRHPVGIAQYVRGHRTRLDTIHERLDEQHGLWLTGSSFDGISINACIEQAKSRAQETLSFLKRVDKLTTG
jgi:oxygen-dependent protoporphyrinogen oxidase